MKTFLTNRQYINEVRSTTASKNRDGYYGSDYIELYNGTENAVTLAGWYLSDDESNLLKSRISDIIVPSKGYAVLYMDGIGEIENSLGFKISSSGEKIFLSNSEGELVDSVLIPELRYGEVYARVKDGSKQWNVMEESLLTSNAEAEIFPQRTLEEPVFSHKSGFYDEAFVLKLKCNFGDTIYYTLDGSIPTKESEVYKDGIYIENVSDTPNVVTAVRNVVTDWQDYVPPSGNVDKAVVVRAVAINEKNCSSEVVTNTYFVGLEQYKDKNIISVVAEYKGLFGDEGIFVTGEAYDEEYIADITEELPTPNFVQSGREWEIPGNLQFFCSGEEICNQIAGIRVYGGSSRYGSIKRMSLFSRNAYSGSEYFEGIVLGGRKVHSMGTNGDIGNLILPQLVLDRSVAVQGIERAQVFLNGEYYSNTDLVEKYSKQYFEQRYGVKGDNLLVIKDGEISEGTEENLLFYKWLLKQAETKDLSIPENYEEIESLMDVQSYIDYICTNVYLCNMDLSQLKNYMLWKSVEDDGTEFGDMRFRWMIYDIGALDGQISRAYYQVNSKAEVNSFSTKGRYVGHSINEHTIYQALKANPLYCKKFVLSFMDMANVNFAIENVEKVFKQWNISTEIYGDFMRKDLSILYRIW